MKKESRVKITSAALALLMATSGIALKSNARAEGGTESTMVTIHNADTNETETVVYIKGVPILPSDEKIQEEENKGFSEYTVVKGDNASIISKKICRIFKIPVTTKYWPVIAYLNNYPRVINPGDVIVYPETVEELENMLSMLKESGWTKRYASGNHVYRKNNNVDSQYMFDSQVTAGQVFDEIYGEGASKNKEFFDLYIEFHKAYGDEVVNDVFSVINENTVLEEDEYFIFTEDIPTMEELYEFKNQKKR